MRLKNLELTDDLRARIRAVEDALAVHVPGRESSAVVDIPKLKLADLLLEEARRQALQMQKLRPAKAALPSNRSRKRA